jgi:hypothetical protein
MARSGTDLFCFLVYFFLRGNFSSSLCVQTGSGAHPAFCTTGTGGPFHGGKTQPGRDADHSPQSSAEFKNVSEVYLLSFPSAFMSCSGTALALTIQACISKVPSFNPDSGGLFAVFLTTLSVAQTVQRPMTEWVR